ncbi:GAF domain-containing protein [Streptomyces sp. NPDC058471]|uniref:GAF domain-containing protein n=1 Tax=Streptomyces sp. NPDC058471 TaxID=3346516 RepID=UPI003649E8AE
MIHGAPGPLPTVSTDTDWESHLPDAIDLSNPPVSSFDAFADLLSDESGLPWAMVNWFGIRPGQQLFVGLSNPVGTDLPQADRTMPELTHGWCPDVVENRRTLILHDTLAYAEFATNPVIDEFGIRTYQGTPLIDPRTDRVWGTICAIGQNVRDRSVGRPSRMFMEHHSGLLVKAVCERSHPLAPRIACRTVEAHSDTTV